MSQPRFQRARTHRMFRRTAGDLTLNSTTWANLPTIGTTWDAVLEAQVGDTLMASVNGRWQFEAVWSVLDVATIVSAAVVNTFSTLGAEDPSGNGIQSWLGPTGAYGVIGAPAFYTVVAGDIDTNGQVTCRLRYRTLSAGNKSLVASSIDPLTFFIQNIGPADPE